MMNIKRCKSPLLQLHIGHWTGRRSPKACCLAALALDAWNTRDMFSWGDFVLPRHDWLEKWSTPSSTVRWTDDPIPANSKLLTNSWWRQWLIYFKQAWSEELYHHQKYPFHPVSLTDMGCIANTVLGIMKHPTHSCYWWKYYVLKHS